MSLLAQDFGLLPLRFAGLSLVALAAGAYGVVNLVIERSTGRDFACKILPKQRGQLTPEKLARKIRTEVELLMRVQVRLSNCTA